MEGMHSNRGITLVEIAIVVAVIAILVLSLGFSYAGWLASYEVEGQIRVIHTDMMSARLMAQDRGRHYFAEFLDATTYRLVEDTNDNGVNDAGAGDRVILPFPKQVKRGIVANGSGVPVTFKFNSRGTITPLRTLRVSHDADPDYDCMVISMTRINIGKMSGSSCVQK